MTTHPPLSDPRVIGSPIRDNGERLVDLDSVPALTVIRGALPSPRLRATVVDRLVTAQSLLPRGVRLLIIDGYRSVQAQDQHYADQVLALRRAHPYWTDAQVLRAADRHCTRAAAAPHRTGGAVDVTLRSSSGWELPIGGPVSDKDAELSPQVLSTALHAVDLVDLVPTWWHWSYGDPYWCYRTGAATACYGPLDMP